MTGEQRPVAAAGYAVIAFEKLRLIDGGEPGRTVLQFPVRVGFRGAIVTRSTQ